MKHQEKIIASKTFTITVLLMVMALGFFLRFNDLGYWLDHKDQYFFNSGTLPVTIGVDPYYYLNIAEDLLDLKIRNFDDNRRVPGGFQRPSAAPLLSVILAALSFITNSPLEWVAVVLPPFLGILLAIPVYLLAYTLTISARIPGLDSYTPNITASKISGFCAALFALISPAYIQRSAIGWCDTDILNVTFVTTFILLAIQIASPKKTAARRKLFVAFGLLLLMFIWWWDQVLSPPLLLAGGPFLLSLFFINYDSRQQLGRYILLFIFFFLFLWVWKGDSFLQLSRTVFGLIDYVFARDNDPVFPALAQLVQEQKNSTFPALSMATGGSVFVYTLSLIGVVLLAGISRRNFLFLAPLLGLNFLAFQATRFAIFTAPLLGLGLGTIVFCCLALLQRHTLLKITVSLALIVSTAFFPIRKAEHLNPPIPTLDPLISLAMQEISSATPEGSVIWTSWGHGHPLVHYSKRKTLADGIYHPTWLQYVLKFPLATDDFRLAANWMQFYTVNGSQGLHKMFGVLADDQDNWAAGVPRLAELLKAGVTGARADLRDKYKLNSADSEELLRFLFPVDCPPLYLFMDYKLIRESWYYLGKFDLQNKIGPPPHTKISIFSYLRNKFSISGSSEKGKYTVNLNNGVTQIIGVGYLDLTRLNYDSRGKTYSMNYPTSRNIAHTLYLKQNDRHKVQFGVLVDNQTADTVFLKLFFEKIFPHAFFSPILDESPVYQLYKVQGEKYQAPGDQPLPF
jgi:asparagine N-glycosylation enzyme membrane subunit Stt3